MDSCIAVSFERMSRQLNECEIPVKEWLYSSKFKQSSTQHMKSSSSFTDDWNTSTNLSNSAQLDRTLTPLGILRSISNVGTFSLGWYIEGLDFIHHEHTRGISTTTTRTTSTTTTIRIVFNGLTKRSSHKGTSRVMTKGFPKWFILVSDNTTARVVGSGHDDEGCLLLLAMIKS